MYVSNMYCVIRLVSLSGGLNSKLTGLFTRLPYGKPQDNESCHVNIATVTSTTGS